VRPFGFGEGFKPLGDLLETLFASRAGHPRIHVRIFVGFASNRGAKVIRSPADRFPGRRVANLLEIFEMAVGMASLALGGRAEYRRYVVVALDIRLLRKIQYRRLAWLSPAKAAFKLSSVLEPISDAMRLSMILPAGGCGNAARPMPLDMDRSMATSNSLE